MKKYMVFDVESAGLHGEGFAVGWVVVERSGKEIERGYASCPLSTAKGGSEQDREWVAKNVLPGLHKHSHANPREVRQFFWDAWMRNKPECLLYAECGWPVEARFLIACIEDSPSDRNWLGPFPLHEVASFEDAASIRKTNHARLPDELPAHNPLADARQSARLLLMALDKLGR